MLLKFQVHVPDAERNTSKLNVRIWNRERFIKDSYMEMSGSCPKNPKLLKVFSTCV